MYIFVLTIDTSKINIETNVDVSIPPMLREERRRRTLVSEKKNFVEDENIGGRIVERDS